MKHSLVYENHTKIIYSHNGEVSNRVVIYGSQAPNLLFIPGWASTEYTWRKFIPFLSENYRVHYFESREKPTVLSRSNSIDLSLASMANDLVVYANSINNLRFMAGASLGATTLIQAFPKLNVKPDKVAFICPNLFFILPKFFFILRRLPSRLVKILRPIALWSIAKFSYGADGEHVAGMLRAMKAGNVDILRQSASQLAEFRLTHQQIAEINIPTLVIGTLQDETHILNHAIQVADTIKLSRMENLPTFTDAHSSRCARLVNDWFNETNID